MLVFPISRHEGRLIKGLEGPEGQELREERKKKKKEEEMRPKRYRIATAIIPYFISCSAFFVRPPFSFYVLGLNVIYVPLGVPLVVLCIFIFSIYHRQSQFLCKVQS